MGVNSSTLTVLAGLSRRGVLKGDVLTLGRHNTFYRARDLRRINHRLALGLPPSACDELARERFADRLFTALGASSCTSMDASDYEGASIVQDLNLPVSSSQHEQYDFIYDGGTTEHIYDVPQAQRNIAAMLKTGGHYFGATPANNECGHGFYQFSPEFYFRSLRAAGMEVTRLYLSSLQFPPQWYAVSDPDETKGRITFRSAESIYVFVVARKTGAAAPHGAPMQSDYEKGNWVTKADHLTRDRSLRAKLLRLADRVVLTRVLWPLNVLARNVALVGSAVWPTSAGIRRIDIYDDVQAL